MIRFVPKVGEHEFLAGWPCSSAAWFGSYEHSANSVEDVGVVKFENPALLRGIVHVENSEIDGGRRSVRELRPGLERMFCVCHPWPVKIQCVKDQRFAF